MNGLRSSWRSALCCEEACGPLGWVVASLCTTGVIGRSLFKDGFLSLCRWQSERCTIGTMSISWAWSAITQPKSSQSCFQLSTRTPRVTGTSRSSPILWHLLDCLTHWQSWGMLLWCYNAWCLVASAAETEELVVLSVCIMKKGDFLNPQSFLSAPSGKARPLCPASLPVSC